MTYEAITPEPARIRESQKGTARAYQLPPAVDLAARIVGGETLEQVAASCNITATALQRRLNLSGYSANGEKKGAAKPTESAVGFTYATQPWMENSACQSVDPELWFSTKPVAQAKAKEICASCPVRVRCLSYALDTEAHTYGMPEGIWGGLTAYSRAKILAERKQAS